MIAVASPTQHTQHSSNCSRDAIYVLIVRVPVYCSRVVGDILVAVLLYTATRCESSCGYQVRNAALRMICTSTAARKT